MLQNWRVWTPTETGREHAMVKIPPMIGSGIQRRHAAIFGDRPENERFTYATFIFTLKSIDMFNVITYCYGLTLKVT